MKKAVSAILFVLFASAFSNQIVAQGFSLGINTGLAVSPGNTVLYTFSTLSSVENEKGTYGEGFPIGITAGYMFNDHFGADLSFSYLIGNKRDFSQSYSFGGASFTSTTTLNSSIVRIMPGVKVSAGSDLKVSPYGRFGLVAGLSPKVTQDTKDDTGELNVEVSGGSTLGWYGAFGVGFQLTDNLTLNTELLLINQSWGPDKATVTDEDGNVTVVNFADEVPSSGAEQTLKEYVPFSSIGLNIGLQFSF